MQVLFTRVTELPLGDLFVTSFKLEMNVGGFFERQNKTSVTER